MTISKMQADQQFVLIRQSIDLAAFVLVACLLLALGYVAVVFLGFDPRVGLIVGFVLGMTRIGNRSDQ